MTDLKAIVAELGDSALSPEVADALFEAILWHDFGKNLGKWQSAVEEAGAGAGMEWTKDMKRRVGKFSLRSSPQLEGLTGKELRRKACALKRLFQPRVRHESGRGARAAAVSLCP